MLKIAVVGASGYSGAELVRLLANHPEARVVAATSETYAGQRLSQLYPGLGPAGDLILTAEAHAPLKAGAVDAVCLALPHGESQTLAPGLLQQGLKVVDLSADFRFARTEIYEQWYGRQHQARDWAGQAVYGLPELFRDQIRKAQLVANPGCFVTGAVLALAPLLRSGLVEPRGLVVDAKTGITGAGRKPKPETAFNQLSENVVPYKLAGAHAHTPEMEMVLTRACGREVSLTFTPQMVPARRGILLVAYARLQSPATTEQLQAALQEAYREEPFVLVRGAADPWPDLACAVGSNACVLKAAVDERTGLALAVASLDNLGKGAAGQAVQNLNLMFGLDETLGLPRTGFSL